MPLYKKEIYEDASIAIWEITENVNDFLSILEGKGFNLNQLESFSNDNRKKEWLACRAALAEIIEAPKYHITYNENNKPILNNYHISFSHSKNYATAIISESNILAIDIECFSEKVLRIKHKFLSEKETSLISKTNEIKELILFWSAKESLFKYYSIGNLDFAKNIEIIEFFPTKEKKLLARIKKDDYNKTMEVFFEFHEKFVLTYIIDKDI